MQSHERTAALWQERLRVAKTALIEQSKAAMRCSSEEREENDARTRRALHAAEAPERKRRGESKRDRERERRAEQSRAEQITDR